ncbi:MAG: YceI family protein [Winogradskyella sp.]|uniref:YceI family protein n=1 Tax=Winogradskyella sp. TaxID=1883156 RepID=UPI0025D14F97|nr:YceI family protein [Winogradskyella sp.]NRB83773.1 YceI family protein [Winogradskyella sp.]
MVRSIQILIILFSFFGTAQNTNSIDFVIRNLGINVDGHFNTFEIDTKFNTNGDLVSIYGKIDVKSIKTGIDSRDEHLLEEDYFNETKFKHITLQSTSITKSSENNYRVSAKLSIKGKTKEIKILVLVKTTGNRKLIRSSFEINRRDFDVGGSSFVMSKTVKIQVKYYQNLP